MTKRFLALIRVAILFAAAGIPVGILVAIWDAWQKSPYVVGISFGSLAVGFAVDSVGLFVTIFAMVGIGFGLFIAAGDPEQLARRPVRRAALIAALVGLAAGVVAYRSGGWGAGASAASWWLGAMQLGALCALTCGALAAFYLRVAVRDGQLGSEQPRRAIGNE